LLGLLAIERSGTVLGESAPTRPSINHRHHLDEPARHLESGAQWARANEHGRKLIVCEKRALFALLKNPRLLPRLPPRSHPATQQQQARRQKKKRRRRQQQVSRSQPIGLGHRPKSAFSTIIKMRPMSELVVAAGAQLMAELGRLTSRGPAAAGQKAGVLIGGRFLVRLALPFS
jgi:hypothetical protein